MVETDEDGRYDLRTIKPGAYPTPRGAMRPSHIHFEVFGKRERLITQLYFAGDPHHDTDTWLQSSPNPGDHRHAGSGACFRDEPRREARRVRHRADARLRKNHAGAHS